MIACGCLIQSCIHKRTGDIDFYKKIFPYADKGEDTVLNHLKRAIEFNLERSGQHGFAMRSVGWLEMMPEIRLWRWDCLCCFSLRYCIENYIEICNRFVKTAHVAWAEKN